MTESIYYGVPMLGTPVFGDQMTNMNIVEESGWGIRVDYKNITETSWDWALKELLNNPKYAESKKKSNTIIFRIFFLILDIDKTYNIHQNY